jgi:tetratricopeptide (TPR) repeat protein
MARLVAASLVTFSPATDRYAVLETVHAFAWERLSEAGEIEPARDAHLAWCRRLAGDAAPKLRGDAAADLVRHLEVEQPNVRAALRWALTDDRHLDEAEQLAHDLSRFWVIIGASMEAAGWIEWILDRPAPLTTERAELALELSDHHSDMGNLVESATHLEMALEMARALDDRRLVGRGLVNLAFFSSVDERAGLAVEAQSIAEAIGDADLIAGSIHMQALLAMRAGRCADAVALYRQSLATGGQRSVADGTRSMLSTVLMFQGRWDAARHELLSAERHYVESGSRSQATMACVALVQVELARGDLDGARRAWERARLWGRPPDDYAADQLVFDATGALLDAVTGDIATAAVAACRLASTPTDVTGHGLVCVAWTLAGEVLARAGDPNRARHCFAKILRHRSGRFPHDRAIGLGGVAGNLPAAAAVIGDDLARVASAIWARHGFATPSWLTGVRLESESTNPSALDDDEAVAIALSFDDA